MKDFLNFLKNQYKWSKIGHKYTEGFLDRCSLSLTLLDKRSEILARFLYEN
jgi:hypothetical protein